MIESVKIKNFRGIKEGEINLAPLTILLGANNSGKTTILEALFLAPNPFRRVPYGDITAVETIHTLHKTLDSEGFAFLFYNYTATQAEIECAVNGEINLLQFIREGQLIYVFTNKDVSSRYTKRDDKSILGQLFPDSGFDWGRIGTGELLMDNTLLVSPSLIKGCYSYLEHNWASIINLGVTKKIAEESSNLVNENYKDITIEPYLGGRLAIYAYLEDGRRIRLGDLGEGIQSYIVARILYELEKPKVLLWDDVESHFNPRILLSIAEWFSDIVDEGKQVIVSTHSLEAARTIASMNEEKARIYLTSLDNGVLKVKELTLEEVERYLEVGIDVRVAEPMLL